MIIGASAASPYLVISMSTLSVYIYVCMSWTGFLSHAYQINFYVWRWQRVNLLLLFIFMHLLINCYNLWLKSAVLKAIWKHLHLVALAPNMLCMLLVIIIPFQFLECGKPDSLSLMSLTVWPLLVWTDCSLWWTYVCVIEICKIRAVPLLSHIKVHVVV